MQVNVTWASKAVVVAPPVLTKAMALAAPTFDKVLVHVTAGWGRIGVCVGCVCWWGINDGVGLLLEANGSVGCVWSGF